MWLLGHHLSRKPTKPGLFRISSRSVLCTFRWFSRPKVLPSVAVSVHKWCTVYKCQCPWLQLDMTPTPILMAGVVGRWRRKVLSGCLIPRFTLWKRLSNQWLIRHMCLCGRALCWRRELLLHPGHESFERQIHSVAKGTWERKGLPSPEWLVLWCCWENRSTFFKKVKAVTKQQKLCKVQGRAC